MTNSLMLSTGGDINNFQDHSLQISMSLGTTPDCLSLFYTRDKGKWQNYYIY